MRNQRDLEAKTDEFSFLKRLKISNWDSEKQKPFFTVPVKLVSIILEIQSGPKNSVSFCLRNSKQDNHDRLGTTRSYSSFCQR